VLNSINVLSKAFDMGEKEQYVLGYANPNPSLMSQTMEDFRHSNVRRS
jgi:hypothetical protein